MTVQVFFDCYTDRLSEYGYLELMCLFYRILDVKVNQNNVQNYSRLENVEVFFYVKECNIKYF